MLRLEMSARRILSKGRVCRAFLFLAEATVMDEHNALRGCAWALLLILGAVWALARVVVG